MEKIIFTILLTALIAATESSKKCLEKENVRKANIDFMTELRGVVQSSLTIEKPNYDGLTNASNLFLNSIKKCDNTINLSRVNVTLFMSFIKFATSDGRFKDFADNGGLTCINSTKPQILKCKTDIVGVSKDSNVSIILEMMSLSVNDWACDKVKEIKTCAMDVLNKTIECNSNKNFIESLFDSMTDYCPDDKVIEKNGSTTAMPKAADSSGQSLLYSVHVIIFAVLGVLLKC